MAGFIEYLSQDGVLVREFHMGQIPLRDINTRQVLSVQLDGDELDHFFNNFQNFPQTRKRVQHWQGDLAKFILENW